jgi:hypothetical protein
MDTLYLVFKHRFQIVIWICLTEAKTSPQANEDFNPGTQPCQADYQPLFNFFFERPHRPISLGILPSETGTVVSPKRLILLPVNLRIKPILRRNPVVIGVRGRL